jgi:energy-converting hydrogenase Eha subunit B
MTSLSQFLPTVPMAMRVCVLLASQVNDLVDGIPDMHPWETTGCITATFIVYGFTQMGFLASDFIAGMVIAILTIQGISHVHAS